MEKVNYGRPIKPWVYIASPYTKGDPAVNVGFQMKVFDHLMDSHLVIPIMPLTSHFIHINFPRAYEEWLEYDEELIRKCDALIRLNAMDAKMSYEQKESNGADREYELAIKLGLFTTRDMNELLTWAATQWTPLKK